MVVVLNFHAEAPPGRHESLDGFISQEYREIYFPAHINWRAPVWHQVQMIMKLAEERIQALTGQDAPDYLILPSDPGVAYLIAHYRKREKDALLPAFVLGQDMDGVRHFHVVGVVQEHQAL